MTPTAEASCIRQANMRLARAFPVYFSGMPEHCDGCGCPLAHSRHFADCQAVAQGGWGYLCPDCIARGRIRFAWGCGQLYQRTDENPQAWLLVAGFPPPEFPDDGTGP